MLLLVYLNIYFIGFQNPTLPLSSCGTPCWELPNFHFLLLSWVKPDIIQARKYNWKIYFFPMSPAVKVARWHMVSLMSSGVYWEALGKCGSWGRGPVVLLLGTQIAGVAEAFLLKFCGVSFIFINNIFAVLFYNWLVLELNYWFSLWLMRFS